MTARSPSPRALRGLRGPALPSPTSGGPVRLSTPPHARARRRGRPAVASSRRAARRSRGAGTPAGSRAGTGAARPWRGPVPYSGSPTTGWPMASRCARIWCVRPVSSRTRSSVSAGSARSTSKCVTAVRGSSVSVETRVRTRRSRPSGASIVPAPRGGPALDQREVLAHELAPRELRLERRVDGLATARRRAGPRCRGRAGARSRPLGILAAGGAARERLGERALAVPARRVDDDARRLVDDDQVLVLPGDREARASAARAGSGRGGAVAAPPRPPRRRARGASGGATPSTVTRPASISLCAAEREPAWAARKTSSRSPAAAGGTVSSAAIRRARRGAALASRRRGGPSRT